MTIILKKRPGGRVALTPAPAMTASSYHVTGRSYGRGGGIHYVMLNERGAPHWTRDARRAHVFTSAAEAGLVVRRLIIAGTGRVDWRSVKIAPALSMMGGPNEQ